MVSTRDNSETTEIRNQPEHGAIVSLRTDQGQLDEDGVCVSVSRQAVDETLSILDDLLEALKGIVADDDASVSLADQRARSDARMAAAKAAILKATGVSE